MESPHVDGVGRNPIVIWAPRPADSWRRVGPDGAAVKAGGGAGQRSCSAREPRIARNAATPEDVETRKGTRTVRGIRRGRAAANAPWRMAAPVVMPPRAGAPTNGER